MTHANVFFSVEDRKSAEERDLEEKIARLNKELARTSEELARASKISAETEIAASESALTAERARQDAQRMQEEYESRRRVEEYHIPGGPVSLRLIVCEIWVFA